MVTQSEKITHNNLVYKYEKSKAKVDTLEQELEEKDKMIKEIEKNTCKY